MVARPLMMLLLLTSVAAAQPRKKDKDKPKPAPAERAGNEKKSDKPKVFDFTGIQFEGRLRTPQLLYFLDRAAEELDRASLERRSFMPELVRTIDEEQL